MSREDKGPDARKHPTIGGQAETRLPERNLERETGIEPATNGLGSRDSTTELLPLSGPIRDKYSAGSRRSAQGVQPLPPDVVRITGMVIPKDRPEAERRLLSVSRSAPLLIERNDMLAMAGYTVSSPREPLDALILLQRESYLAVLIGHTVPEHEADVIADKARSLGIPAIFVYHGKIRVPEWADLAVEIDSGVGRLLNFLDQRYDIAS
jgi:hypothetical protein